MTLNEQLQALKEKSRERIAAESSAIMERAVDDLRGVWRGRPRRQGG